MSRNSKLKRRRYAKGYAHLKMKPEHMQLAPANYPSPECLKTERDAAYRYTSEYRGRWHTHLPTEPAAPVEVRVRCNGSMHRVSYHNHRLHLLDHPDKRRTKIMANFGPGCRCLRLLLDWKTLDERGIPDGLKAVFRFTRLAVRQYRRYLQNFTTSRLQERSLPTRDQIVYSATSRVQVEASAAVSRCRYANVDAKAKTQAVYYAGGYVMDDAKRLPRVNTHTLAKFNLADAEAAAVRDGGEPVMRKIQKESCTLSTGDGWNSNHFRATVGLKPSWIVKVFDRGLSVVDGHFVTDVATAFDRSWYAASTPEQRLEYSADYAWWLALGEPLIGTHHVLALRLVGGRLQMCPAVAAPDAAGDLRLTWVEKQKPARNKKEVDS